MVHPPVMSCGFAPFRLPPVRGFFFLYVEYNLTPLPTLVNKKYLFFAIIFEHAEIIHNI